jgi:uncharacterized membrane protein YeaQ/YmgE (transglycosylase-associated protein family)
LDFGFWIGEYLINQNGIRIRAIAAASQPEDKMDINHVLIQIVIAVICAGVANILVPRRIPGKLVGLILIGWAGVWLGDWGFALLRREYGINFPFLTWQIQGVLIIPAILGCAVVLYLVTTFIKWGRYST